MSDNPLTDPLNPVGFLLMHLRSRAAAARDDRGASAVEWVVITALLVGIALVVGGVLWQTISDKANEINLDTP